MVWTNYENIPYAHLYVSYATDNLVVVDGDTAVVDSLVHHVYKVGQYIIQSDTTLAIQQRDDDQKYKDH